MVREVGVANSRIVNGDVPFPMRLDGWEKKGSCILPLLYQRHPSRHPWNSCVPRRRINTPSPFSSFPSCPFFLLFSLYLLLPSFCVPVSSGWTAMSFVLLYLRLEHHQQRWYRFGSRDFTRLTVYFHVYKQAGSLVAIYFETRWTCRFQLASRKGQQSFRLFAVSSFYVSPATIRNDPGRWINFVIL